MEINRPGLKITRRSEFSKTQIEYPFKDLIDLQKLEKDYNLCTNNLYADATFFGKIDGKLFLYTPEINASKCKYLFLPDNPEHKIVLPDDIEPSLKNIETVFFPNTDIRISGECFKKSSIKFLYLPPTVRIIHTKAFMESSIENIIYNPGETVKYIPPACFAYCIDLKDVKLKDTITIIGKCAFEECAFNYIKLPESLEQIDERAFYNTNLKKITIPKNTFLIEEEAFHIDTLEEVIIENMEELHLKQNVFASKLPYKVTLICQNEENVSDWIERNEHGFVGDVTINVVVKNLENIINDNETQVKQNTSFDIER